MSETISVGIADLKVAKNPAKLVTIGLGSCVGIALYDSTTKNGALIHVMLPEISQGKSNENKAKYADSAIPMALELLEKEGAKKSNIQAKIAGGARMFSFKSEQKFIGDRNLKAVKEALEKEKIKVLAEDTGGNQGRTMELETDTGKVSIKTALKGIVEL